MVEYHLFTIGFVQTSAEQFFKSLSEAGVRKVVDVRLRNVSQLSGYAKQSDLRYFLKELGNIEYEHAEVLAPTNDILDQYRKKQISWEAYEQRFLHLMADRKIENAFSPASLADSCLLCSEKKPHHCHRGLVAKYLNQKWGDVLSIHHL